MATLDTIPASVIVPVLNERENIAPLVEALLGQTVPPDEIVIADGGSTDGTREYLDQKASVEPRLRVIDGPGGISENRNAAITVARNEVIACTDAGCVPERDWLDVLVAPFRQDVDWVAGMSRPAGSHPTRIAMGLALMPVPEEVNPEHFVPGGASQAFRKSAWRRVGGFPEGMEAGEDTIFGQRMLSAGFRPVFRPGAMVRWVSPGGLADMTRKAFRWGYADGMSGYGSSTYLRVLMSYYGPPLLAAALLLIGQPLWAIVGIGALAVLTVVRTRRKYRWVPGLAKWVLVPLAHILKMWSQGVGWIAGFLRRPDRSSLGSYGKRLGLHTLMWAKRRVRPYVPDRLMALTRDASVPHISRVNVDVIAADLRSARRWVRATPATYRARTIDTFGTGPLVGDAQVVSSIQLDRSGQDLLLRPLCDPEISVSVIAETEPPTVNRTLIVEPHLRPLAVAVSSDAWPDIEGTDPETVTELARQAGCRMALFPRDPSGAPGSEERIGGAGSLVMLGTVPMHDVGGGSRGAQMTQELLARGYHVVHTYLYDTAESVDLGLRFIHPDLEHMHLDDFDIGSHVGRLDTKDRLAVMELPHPAFLPVVKKLRDAGYQIVYDRMDDWSDPALGGWGWAQWAEDAICVASDVLVGSAPALVRQIVDMTGREAVEIPNAVNTRLFAPGSYERPPDLPDGDGPVIEYHGSLYGNWFDWTSVRHLASSMPQARIIMIGDDRNHPAMPDNVHFLGLKPQFALPAYLSYTDVAIIPFVVSETTHSVSPLKVFEYLAMGVPVAASPLEPLLHLDGVTTDVDLAAAVRRSLASPRPDPETARSRHGWGTRMTRLFEAAGLALQEDPDARPVRTVQRTTVRYAESERILT